MRCLACVSILLTACAAPNPEYDDSRSSGTEGATEGATTLDSADESEDAPEVCEDQPDDALKIELWRGEQTIDPQCVPGQDVLWLGFGDTNYGPPYDFITHEECDPPVEGCGCPGITRQVRFGGTTMVPPGLTNCAELGLWAAEIEGECVWAGVMLREEGSAIPEYVVSRTLDVPPLGIGFGLEEDHACESPDCVRDPGAYHLEVFGEIVPVEGDGHPVEIPFAVEVPYEIDNRMSWIDDECVAHIAWIAVSR